MSGQKTESLGIIDDPIVFVVGWMLLTTVATGLALMVAFSLSAFTDNLGLREVVRNSVFGVTFGMAIIGMQSLMLNRKAIRMWWPNALCYPAAMVVFLNFWEMSVPLGFLVMFLCALAVGCLQYVLGRKHFRKSYLWILITPLALVFVVGSLPQVLYRYSLWFVPYLIVAGLGSIPHGILLSWQLRHPVPLETNLSNL